MDDWLTIYCAPRMRRNEANTGRTGMTPSVVTVYGTLGFKSDFDQSNSGRVVYAAHDRGVVTRR